jgi:hypothetical protein
LGVGKPKIGKRRPRTPSRAISSHRWALTSTEGEIQGTPRKRPGSALSASIR